MIRRFVLAVAGILLALSPATGRAPAPPRHDHNLRFVDLTGAFDSFWAQTQGMDDQRRVAAFRARFASLIPGFYDGARLHQNDPAVYNARILRALAAYAEARPRILEVSQRFAELFAPARASFEGQFGPFAARHTVYLLHSLGEMDGGQRSLPEGNVLVFGADVIARLHLDHDIRPFFHHELFHVFQGETFSGCEVLWCGLWNEGLATYVAHRLNPGASDAELLLTMPEPIRPAVEAHRQEAICAALSRLDSTSDADGNAMFSSSRLNDHLPPRFGYYVGYLVASEAGRTHSLAELARMRPAQARPLVEAALHHLADCPG